DTVVARGTTGAAALLTVVVRIVTARITDRRVEREVDPAIVVVVEPVIARVRASLVRVGQARAAWIARAVGAVIDRAVVVVVDAVVTRGRAVLVVVEQRRAPRIVDCSVEIEVDPTVA